jgi:hypothetical protein
MGSRRGGEGRAALGASRRAKAYDDSFGQMSACQSFQGQVAGCSSRAADLGAEAAFPVTSREAR